MNSLQLYCEVFRIDPIKAMNLLQEWGAVSDNCVTVEDVAACDQDLAIRFCKLNQLDLRD